jgi:hypothetical protein
MGVLFLKNAWRQVEANVKYLAEYFKKFKLHNCACSTDWATAVRFRAEAKFFPLVSVSSPNLRPTPASYAMGIWGPFPRVKARLGRDADHSLNLVPRSRMSRSYTTFPLVAYMVVAGQLYVTWQFLAVSRHATVAVAVRSTVHSPANYKIQLYIAEDEV